MSLRNSPKFLDRSEVLHGWAEEWRGDELDSNKMQVGTLQELVLYYYSSVKVRMISEISPWRHVLSVQFPLTYT